MSSLSHFISRVFHSTPVCPVAPPIDDSALTRQLEEAKEAHTVAAQAVVRTAKRTSADSEIIRQVLNSVVYHDTERLPHRGDR